jgi:hypothetical protein
VLRDTQVPEDEPNDARVGEEGKDSHVTVAGRAPEGVHLVDPRRQLSPATAGAAVRRVAAGGAGDAGGPVGWVAPSVLTPMAGRLSSPPGVGRKDAVVAVSGDARMWNKACEPIDQLERARPCAGWCRKGRRSVTCS